MCFFFFFAPILGEDEPILTSIFFKWVETTNQKTNTDSHVIKLITKQIEHTFCCVWGIPVHYKCTSIFIFNVFVHSHRIHGTIVYLPT